MYPLFRVIALLVSVSLFGAAPLASIAAAEITPQEKKLIRMLRRGPQVSGCRSDRWDALEIANLIEREFGVSYCCDHIKPLLTRIAGGDFAEELCPGWGQR